MNEFFKGLNDIIYESGLESERLWWVVVLHVGCPKTTLVSERVEQNYEIEYYGLFHQSHEVFDPIVLTTRK